MEEETVASKEVTVVNGGKKGDEEASLKMELQVKKETFCAEESFKTAEVKAAESANSVTEPSSAADESSVEELMAEQVLSKKKKKKLAAQEKMRVLELENAELKDQLSFSKERVEQMTEAEQKLNALQENLVNLLSENKELSGIKEAYESLSLQLERSKENMKDSSLREEELERLLEAAELSAKDVKEQISSLLQEPEGLHERIVEKEKLDESLMSEELELLRTSERQLKEDLSEAESLLVSTKNDLQVKAAEFEEVQLKLEEEVAVKKSVVASFRSQALKLQADVAELTENFEQMRDRCIDLESELKLSREEKFSKVDSELEQKLKSVEEETRLMELEESESKLEEMNGQVCELRGKLSEVESELSQSLALKSELESSNTRVSGLELLMEEKCRYAETESVKHSDMVSALTTQLQSANTATEEARLRFQESEWKVEGEGRINAELEHQLSILKSEHDDGDRKLKEQSVEASGLTIKLEEMETEKEQMNLHELSGKVFELDSELSRYLVLKSELEAELKKVGERCAEHERQANATHERNLELQDLVQSSHFKIEDLERERDSLVWKCDQTESASKEYADMVSVLTTELENSRLATSSVEKALEAAAESERRLAESLNVITEERRKSEEALHDSLVATQGKLESVENDLMEAGIRENEITKKLESAEVQLQQQGKVLEEATTKTIELESVNHILVKDTELKLMDKIKSKDSEVKSLHEKMQILEHQIKYHEHHSAEAAFKAAELFSQNGLLPDTNSKLTSKVSELQQLLDSANAEWEEVAQQLARSNLLQSETQARFLEAQAELHDTIHKLASKELEGKELDDKCSNLEDQLKIHEFKVYELSDKVHDQEKMNEALELAESESKLNDLHQKLSAALAEKDSAVENFETSFKAAEDLKKELSSDRHSFQCIIASIMEEKQLLEEANTVTENGLQTLIAELDRQLKEYKESNGALKGELENLKLQVHGRVEEQILMNEAQFNKEITSVMEEKKLLSEANTMAQDELQTLIAQLEEQLVEYKEGNEALHAELENTKLQAIQYFALQTRVKELEELLLATEVQFKKEVENIEAAAAAREAEMTSMLDQYVQKLRGGEAFNEKVQHLEAEVLVFSPTADAELKEENFKLEFVQEGAEIYPLEPVIYKEKGDGPGEAKRLDISVSTLKKKKMKKPGKSSKQQTPSPTTEANAPSPINNIKIAVGVGLVSIIASILAGKK